MTETGGYAGELLTLFGVLEKGWCGVGGLHRDIPIAKPWGEKLDLEKKCKGPQGEPKPYLRFSVRNTDGRAIEIGNPGNNAHSFVGVLMIDVFVNPADGSPLARKYGDEILALYRVARPYIQRHMSYTDVGPTSTGWYQGAVTITFDRHEQH